MTDSKRVSLPKMNTIFARYKFNDRLLVKQCGYANSDEMVRDRIVFATNPPQVREKLSGQGSDLMLRKPIDIARSYEVAQDQPKTMISPRASTQAPMAAHAVFSKW